ncbi:DUF6879 family protein [Pseudonocardia sp. MH-G8]|uniref:DUF6879 family protein n=1 Tax=Pseudonocardia sp. MH-G8 TaxID=1854588 RepID=UPI000BA142AE|nr:DUF6879 family protein [Pseudonocardia sp. MH-G8]OZM82628.1 hypothetical protein CFP66_07875 [Pseudonocardia sp. MH-G8]
MTAEHSRGLTASEFDSLFDRFETSVARLEALPAYAVGGAEAERLSAYRQGRARPLRSVVTDPWLARMAISTLTAGKSWTRVRVVDEPLTDYQRYQLQSYRESQAVGEQVQIAPRSQVGDVGTDFWLFDEHGDQPRAVLMHYHSDGRLDRREIVEHREQIADLVALLRRVAVRAVPLNEFLSVGCG